MKERKKVLRRQASIMHGESGFLSDPQAPLGIGRTKSNTREPPHGLIMQMQHNKANVSHQGLHNIN